MKESYESTMKVQNFVDNVIDGVKAEFIKDLDEVQQTGIPQALGIPAIEVLSFKNIADLYSAITSNISRFNFDMIKKIPLITKYFKLYHPSKDNVITFDITSPELDGKTVSINFGYGTGDHYDLPKNKKADNSSVTGLYGKGDDGVYFPFASNVPPAIYIYEVLFNNPNFVSHELTHYYQDKFQNLPAVSDKYYNGTDHEYHNDPSEMNAYFHETIAFFERYLKDVLENIKTSEDLDWFIKKIIKSPNGMSYYIDDFDPEWDSIYKWYNDLTDKNKQKIIKKLGEYIQNKYIKANQ